MEAKEYKEPTKEQMDTFEYVIENGGCFFICNDCKETGAIKPNIFTTEVRKQKNKPIPEPAIVVFNKCEEHTFLELDMLIAD